MVLCRTADRSLGLFLRPPITLAKTHQRAHQRHAPPLAAQKHQPQHRPNTPLHHRGQPQPHATTTTQLAQPPPPLQSTNEHPPLELAGVGHAGGFLGHRLRVVRVARGRWRQSHLVGASGSQGTPRGGDSLREVMWIVHIERHRIGAAAPCGEHPDADRHPAPKAFVAVAL